MSVSPSTTGTGTGGTAPPEQSGFLMGTELKNTQYEFKFRYYNFSGTHGLL